MNKMLKKVLVVLLLGCWPVVAFAADAKNAVTLMPGFGAGPDSTAFLMMGEYERLIAPHLSVNGRLAMLDYEYDDGDYEEDGDGVGVEAGVRFYPTREGMSGFYVGLNLGFWSSEWDFIEDKGTFFEQRGSGDSDAVNLNATVGVKIPLGERFYIQPAAILGNFFSVDDSCTYSNGASCDNEAELGFYLAGAFGAGLRF